MNAQASRFRVVHKTTYKYEEPVTESHGFYVLHPRNTSTQVRHSSSIEVSPEPSDLGEHDDVYGNRVGYFAVHEPHETLIVTATNEVTVTAPVLPKTSAPWEEIATAVRAPKDPDLRLTRQFLLPSPAVDLHPSLLSYGQASFTAGRPVLDAYADLVHRINADFAFDPSATDVTTDVDEVLAKKAGVCQDFAHVAIACLRSLGLPARYVSGYLETDPPPGKTKLQGADASHAWVSLGVPGLGWVDADPTNDQFLSDRHVTVAWGRDYRDVTPLKGVIYTGGGTDSLDVEVDVLRV